MRLSEAAKALWAKSDDQGLGHPLMAHLLDVAATWAKGELATRTLIWLK